MFGFKTEVNRIKILKIDIKQNPSYYKIIMLSVICRLGNMEKY